MRSHIDEVDPALTEQLIRLCGVEKTYASPAQQFTALRGIDLDVAAGEFVAVVGRSGSGKSTLLNVLAGIDAPSAGTVEVAGREVHSMTQDELAVWRGVNVGVVFQFFQLLPTLTVAENVMLPMDLRRAVPPRERLPRARRLLERVGILEHADKLPDALSGGQQQRAAVARALANDPPIIVADEPTGNLDARTAEEVFVLFRELADAGKTLVVVTHEREIERWAMRTVVLDDGSIADSGRATGEATRAANIAEALR